MNVVRNTLLLASLLALAACHDSDPLAPTPPVGGDIRRLSGCLWLQLNASGPSGQNQIGSLSYPPTLGQVVIRADMPVWWGSLTHSSDHVVGAVTAAQVFAQMECSLQGTGSTLSVIASDSAVLANTEPLPLPPEVDRNFWDALSAKEQRALLEIAKILRRVFPATRSRYRDGHYDAEGTEGAWIQEHLRPMVLNQKMRSHLEGLDYGFATYRGAIFGASHYACSMMQNLRGDSEWPLYPDETLEFVLELGDAFGYSYFATQQVRAYQIVRTMALVTGAAAHDLSGRSCRELTRSMFQNDRTLWADPLDGAGLPDGDNGGGGGQDPGGTLLKVMTGR
jgi:hypothetical protein